MTGLFREKVTGLVRGPQDPPLECSHHVRNKCIASSNKCLTSSNKKLLVTSAFLLDATRNKKLLAGRPWVRPLSWSVSPPFWWRIAGDVCVRVRPWVVLKKRVSEKGMLGP